MTYTTLKTEIFVDLNNDFKHVFETLYAGNQKLIYKINGRTVAPEFWFEFKNEHAPYIKNFVQIK